MVEISRRGAVIGATALAAAAVGRGARAGDAEAKGRVDAAFKAITDSGRIAGVVAVAANEGGIIHSGVAGKRDIANGPAMTEDSVFWIASMTKAVTSVAGLQQVEAGKLSLEAPIADILPELKDPQVLTGFDAAGQPMLRPAKRPITLHHLLTHTAGFTYDIWNANTARYLKVENLPGIISCKNDSLKIPLEFDPGERWDYGTNIDWVGKAVERVSGQNLEAYFREHIFSPLGMTDTSFRISPSQRARLVSMHQRQPVAMHMPESDGELKTIGFEIPQDPEFLMGGGGLYGTAGDYLRFTQMILHGGSFNGARILSPETVAMASRNQIGEVLVTKLITENPGASNDAEFFPGMPKKWGFGFMINEKPAPTGRSAGSLAWAGLGNTYFWIDPTRKVTGVILMQLLPFADANALELFGQFERGVYAMI